MLNYEKQQNNFGLDTAIFDGCACGALREFAIDVQGKSN